MGRGAATSYPISHRLARRLPHHPRGRLFSFDGRMAARPRYSDSSLGPTGGATVGKAGRGPEVPESPRGRLMPLVCPQCRGALPVGGSSTEAVVCPHCGSSVQPDPEATLVWLPGEAPRRLGKFDILQRLGVGAFGTVYKARDTELDRLVALKIPRVGNMAGPEERERFLREARSAARLEHPAIVSLYDAGQVEGTCYLVAEFIP